MTATVTAMTSELKPCTRCGGKLRPVKSKDGSINAIYCDKCRTLHILNYEYGSMEETIEQYNRLYDGKTGENDAD